MKAMFLKHALWWDLKRCGTFMSRVYKCIQFLLLFCFASKSIYFKDKFWLTSENQKHVRMTFEIWKMYLSYKGCLCQKGVLWYFFSTFDKSRFPPCFGIHDLLLSRNNIFSKRLLYTVKYEYLELKLFFTGSRFTCSGNEKFNAKLPVSMLKSDDGFIYTKNRSAVDLGEGQDYYQYTVTNKQFSINFAQN